MAHKVRCDVSFSSMEEYLTMKKQLDNTGLKFDAFVTYSLNYTWNLMLEQYSAQLKEEGKNTDALASIESSRDKEETLLGNSPDTQASANEPADSPQEG